MCQNQNIAFDKKAHWSKFAKFYFKEEKKTSNVFKYNKISN